MQDYIFTSERLGFRNWQTADLIGMAEINSDKEVMEFFPALLTKEQSWGFIQRMQQLYKEKGYCYFAVDELASNEFIGFIGLSDQSFEADFTPCVDIGWRLSRSEWNKGYATEGARACLDFAFNRLGLEKIVAIAPAVNSRSEQVMKKLGMQKEKTFIHPSLTHNSRLQPCVLYQKLRTEHLEGQHSKP